MLVVLLAIAALLCVGGSRSVEEEDEMRLRSVAIGRQAQRSPAPHEATPEKTGSFARPLAAPVTGAPTPAEQPESLALHLALRAQPHEAAYARLYAIAALPESARRHRRSLCQIGADRGLHDSLRGLAIWALARIGELGPVEAGLAPDYPRSVRLLAISMMRRYAPEKQAWQVTHGLLASSDPVVGETALRSLAHIDRRRAFGLLLRAGRSGRLRRVAIALLGASDRREALDVVLAYLPADGDDVGLRTKARALFDLRKFGRARVKAELAVLLAGRPRPGRIRSEIQALVRSKQ